MRIHAGDEGSELRVPVNGGLNRRLLGREIDVAGAVVLEERQPKLWAYLPVALQSIHIGGWDAREIPGFRRLGSYYRFCSQSVDQWLGGLDQLFVAEQIATLMKVPESWVYTNANEIPGVLRLGRYVRFRPLAIQQFLAGSDVVQ